VGMRVVPCLRIRGNGGVFAGVRLRVSGRAASGD
jgi:hypothetical protein